MRERAERHDGVAVDDLAALVDHDHPVGVAVEGDADRGAAAHDLGFARARGGARRRRWLMFSPFGFTPSAHHVGAELREDRAARRVGGAVRRVDDDAHAVEREPRGNVPLQKTT